jgi:hypothetical protein
MATFQLYLKDEYNQGSIIKTSDDYEELVKAAKLAVNDDNVNNSLTLEAKRINWESYYVEIIDSDGDLIDNVLYSGQTGQGYHKVIVVEDYGDDYDIKEVLLDNINASVRFFIGDFDGEPEYASHLRKGVVNDFKDQAMDQKQVYYILRTR